MSRRFTYCRALFDALIYTYPDQTSRITLGCISPHRYGRGRNDTGSAIAPRLSRRRGVREIERPSDDPALVIHSSLLPLGQSHPAMRFLGADCLRTTKRIRMRLAPSEKPRPGRFGTWGAEGRTAQQPRRRNISRTFICRYWEFTYIVYRSDFEAQISVRKKSFFRLSGPDFHPTDGVRLRVFSPGRFSPWHVFDVRFLPALEALK